jgi:hypothetical protein
MSRPLDGDEREDVPADTTDRTIGVLLKSGDVSWADAASEVHAAEHPRDLQAQGRPDAAHVGVADASPSYSREIGDRERQEQARDQVKAVFALEDAELLGSSSDFRQEALDRFDLDPNSMRRATELGQALAKDMPLTRWEDENYSEREQTTRNFGLELSQKLDLAPKEPDIDPDMSPRLLGMSDGPLVRVNGGLLENGDPTQTIETVAHEYRHQWQDSVANGRLEHPEGGRDFVKLVSASKFYASDLKRESRYAHNYLEVDAEAFARAVSKAYNDAQYH